MYCIVSHGESRGMHKRENFLWPGDALGDFALGCFERGSEVIGSSE